MSAGVAITGIGLVTALGATREETWRRMLAGECGIRAATVFDTDGYRSRVAAEVDMTADRRRRHAARAAAPVAQRSHRSGGRPEALADSGLLDGSLDRSRVGVFLGAGTADLLRNEDVLPDLDHAGLERTRRSDVWNHFPSTPVDVIARRFGFEGPRACVVAACSSSTIAIGRGVEAIRSGRADAVLAGGTDALARLTFSGFNLLRLMDPEPCRPFDRSRAGMNIGEGAGMLVLEDLSRRAGAARPSTRSSPDTAWGAKRSIRRRRSPKVGRSRPSWRSRSATPASMRTRSTTSTRTARRRRRTTPPKRGGSGVCSASAARAFRSRRSSR